MRAPRLHRMMFLQCFDAGNVEDTMLLRIFWVDLCCDSLGCPTTPQIYATAQPVGVRFLGADVDDCCHAAMAEGWRIGQHVVLCPHCIDGRNKGPLH